MTFTEAQIQMLENARTQVAQEEAQETFLGVPFQAEFEDLPREETTNRPIFPTTISANTLQIILEAFREHNDRINTIEGYTGTGFGIIPKKALEGSSYSWSDQLEAIVETTYSADAEGQMKGFEVPVRGAFRFENDTIGAQYIWDANLQQVIANAFGAEDEGGFIQTLTNAGVRVLR